MKRDSPLSPLHSVLASPPVRTSGLVVLLLVTTLLLPFLLTVSSLPLKDTVPLVVTNSLDVPVPEVSAFAVRSSTASPTPRIFALGDKLPLVAELVATWRQVRLTETRSLQPALGVSIPACSRNDTQVCRRTLQETTAQWEAAALDREGRLWALQENTRTVHVFSSDFSTVEAHIHLPSLQSQDAGGLLHGLTLDGRSPKGGLEGIALLPRNHVLIAHQSRPAALIEFGPQGEAPQGWNPNEPDERAPWKLPRGTMHTYAQLTAWTLPGRYANCSLNDIATEAGHLLVLSSSCKAIFIVDSLASEKNFAEIIRTLALPAGIRKPEALAVISPGTYLVGDDAAIPGTANVHVLQEVVAENVSADVGSFP